MTAFFNNNNSEFIEIEISVNRLITCFNAQDCALKKHNIIKYLSALGCKFEKIEPGLSITRSSDTLNLISDKIKQHYPNGIQQRVVLQTDAWLFYAAFIARWCLRKEQGNAIKDKNRRRLQKINQPGVNLPRFERHHIKWGLYVLDCFVSNGLLSKYIRNIIPGILDKKLGISTSEYSQYCSAIKKWDEAIQSYDTQAQKRLKYFNHILVAVMIVAGIGATFALFMSLLKPWPPLAVGVSLLMVTANFWVKKMSLQKTGCALVDMMGYGGLGLTEWIDENGKQTDLPRIRKLILYFSLLLSVITGFNLGAWVYMGLLNAQGTALFFLAYPPVALFFAASLFILVVTATAQSFLNTLKKAEPIQDLFVLPFKSINALFDPIQPFNATKSVNALKIAQCISYSLFCALSVVGVSAILIGAYLSAQLFISTLLVPIGFSYMQALMISYALNLGLLPLGQLPFLIKTTADAWGAPLTELVYRAICGPLALVNPSMENPNTKLDWSIFLKEKLTYLFSFCVVIENFIRFYQQMHANTTLKARKNLIIGCKTYLLATQTYSNITKQGEDKENLSRRALQVHVAQKAVGIFKHQASMGSSSIEETQSLVK